MKKILIRYYRDMCKNGIVVSDVDAGHGQVRQTMIPSGQQFITCIISQY